MLAVRKVVLGVLSASVLLSIAGCPVAATESRTNNQGGGSLITAGAKILGQNMSTLTADEIQILADKAAEFAPADKQEQLTLSDEQAAAVTDFIDANGVDSVSDLEALIQQAEDDPGSIVIPESVLDLIEGGAFDA